MGNLYICHTYVDKQTQHILRFQDTGFGKNSKKHEE